MADKILKELTLKIWRQKDAKSKGEFKTYKVHNISTGTSFLEMLDILNEQTTSTANTFTTVMIECYRFFVLFYQLFVENIEHFQK